MERVKPFWLVKVTLVVSATIVLAAACGKEIKAGSNDDEDGGKTAAGKGGGGSSGNEDDKGTGGTAGKAGTGGSSSMDSGALDGATQQPVISTGNVQEDEVCSLSIGGMGTGMGMGGGQTMSFMSGKCIKTDDSDSCAGGVATSSDCATGLSCCVNTDACESLSSAIQDGGGAQFGVSFKCVTSGSCPAFSMGGMGGGMGGFSFTPEFQMGCPEGQSCCMSLPDGGFQFPEGGFRMPDGGFNFEGGFGFGEGGFQPPDAGTN
jgi:hypothetical protein